ncbi:Ger(x)C family spore germination protein [Paenibacillus sp. ACRRX]|uniref:Ger(x)C family spore germination protein n=1 Tax=Paenibacillus sp. ACRRX TaxID=2918206 RepID=UPI001EF66E85|nr:Ger(x)C family spore germination protein [Paenibacillus sp. ACRRX]MCG7407296.1 Ger(x)C family spore germination protein [Paenibacillus sp. ACRRX]
MNRTFKRAALLVCSLFLTTGCVRTSVLERLSLGVAVGYDRLPDNKMSVTTVTLASVPEAKEKRQVVSVEALTSKGARMAMNQQMARLLVSGQIRVILYNDKLAKEGVIDIADTLSRDPSYGDMIYLVVSDMSTRELLSFDYAEYPNIGLYLYGMIDQNVRNEWVPSCTVHEFRRDYYSIGKQPVLPIVARQNGKILIKSLALFRGGKMVGEATREQGSYLKLLLRERQPSQFEVVMPMDGMRKFIKKGETVHNKVNAVISNLSSSSSLKLVSSSPLTFKVRIKMKAELQEISENYDFTDKEAIGNLQAELSKNMSAKLMEALNHFQKLDADVVGFGEVYRSSIRNSKLNPEVWQKLFTNARFDAQVEVNLIRTGTIE